MPKNLHAVALGRKGGKKTGRKGFAAMSRAEGDRIRTLAAEARKAEKIGYCASETRRDPVEIFADGVTARLIATDRFEVIVP